MVSLQINTAVNHLWYLTSYRAAVRGRLEVRDRRLDTQRLGILIYLHLCHNTCMQSTGYKCNLLSL